MKIKAPPPRVFRPTVSEPLLDDFSLRAARQRAKQAPGTPPVAPLPVRQHPMWSGNNEIGRETGFAPDANNRQMVLKMAEWGPPVIWTVGLGLQYDRNRTPDTVFAVAAEIQFGIGGAVQIVEVDWMQGAAITLPANSLVITALYPLNNVAANTTVPADLLLRATVSAMSAHNAAPTRSHRQAFTTAVTSIEDDIPPFAKSVYISMGGQVAGIDLFDFYINTFVSFRFESSAPPFAAAVPVALYKGTQLLSYIDFTNELLGAPMALPIPEGARSVQFIWAPGGVPANPPTAFPVQFAYKIGV